MALFAISDLHLALGNKDKIMDVFPGWEGYTERLKKNWEALISPDDTVVVAGDVSWGLKLDEALRDLKFLDSLPGHKILIKGNHDLWWSTCKKLRDFLKDNSCHTIDFVYNDAKQAQGVAVCGSRGWLYNSHSEQERKIVTREAGRIDRSVTQAKQMGLEPVVFIHYPPIYSDICCEDIVQVLLKHDIKTCYYGHIHGGIAVKHAVIGKYRGIDFKLISADYLKFIPKLVKK